VILLLLDQGMQEEAHTRTDAQGAFALKVQHTDKLHLVRVIHQGVNYDQRASAGDVVSIDVFDAARKVQGVTGSIEIIRAGTNGNLLHISDMVEIRNESSPPLTQVGERTFEVYLPAHAKIDSVLAAGPGKIGVIISAAPVRGQPGHYTVSFPLRPGATKFAFNYDLPYDGHAAFQTRLAYPLQQLAVMIPPTMQFSSSSPAFQVLATGNSKYQVEAANRLNAGEGPGFEVSGTGALPPLGDQADSQERSRPSTASYPLAATAPVPRSIHLPSLASIDSHLARARSSSQSLVLGVVSAIVLAASCLLVWRARKPRPVSSAKSAITSAMQSPRSTTLLESVKREMLQLEADRRRGSVSGEEYASTRQALEETVKRAVAKAGS
jgi:hypothetical protein